MENLVTTQLAAVSNIALPAGFGADLGKGIGAIALYAIIGLVLMLIGFYAIDWTTPGKLSDLVRTGKPNAVIVTASGMLSMALIIVVAIYFSASDLTAGLITSVVYGLIGIVVQVLAVRTLEWVTKLDVGSTIQDDKFAPASVVVAAVHIALGLIVAVAIS
ncbi:DUF350 domain-containing protein [Actinokineospora globicatena]|uniref:DUF350 domain-containing protein n=1 Tax=Actinokineospora globicatena TaxID=103729 RepID=A0A9W6V847_9PSEU|nr:DUF350 domain-containing protein [Actinokineospora globicatena]GLW77241.1 DUF350 domain-containing protein [Actinokineospora globicatena]GLW84075.1 DUF350 domain-containing protein [Actinokineospora globicatena]GLW91982.1 DUF350 domain-containing protein [Actinokineospora globicatena]